MDERMINNALDDSDNFSSDSFDDNDSDPIYCVENENNSDSQESSDDEDQIENQILPISNNSQSNWNTVTGTNQKNFNFTGNSGPLVILDEDIGPMDYFKLFLTDNIIELMVIETNRNAQQFLNTQTITRGSRFSFWQPINKNDMEKFMGLLMWMGLVKMTSIADYWSKAERYKNGVAPKIMSRNKFELILRFWHFEDNETADKTDRLYKVRKLLNMANDLVKNINKPGEIIAVDESMIPFRGRLKFRQYIPNKTHKYGVKFFKVCGTNGYTYKIIIYEGKQSKLGEALSETIVTSLCENYLNEGRTIVTDNFYTSVPLAETLLRQDTHLVGTLRKNRRFLPKTVIEKKLKKGEFVGLENNSGIVVSKFKDKRDIHLLSTRHQLNMTNTGKKNRNQEDILKPDIILFYNAGKAGIDISDQLASYCTPMRKMLVDKLLELKPTSLRVSNSEQPLENRFQRRQIIKHKLEETEEKCSRNRKKRNRCIECYTKFSNELGYKEALNKAKKVTTFCSLCPSKPSSKNSTAAGGGNSLAV
ncbi:piggyBac transposable element-derived protein 4-like [Rhopalosiphum maidis]|uniref:piggyBac transposable element-derived protein 4-like n=1 Tax=Rhopalosiphum maidis TaxID=43146 RepID=UPI000F009E9B|nr:piggyBac transposable element-derived protein 4-like [Rhopalosiphum maidis]